MDVTVYAFRALADLYLWNTAQHQSGKTNAAAWGEQEICKVASSPNRTSTGLQIKPNQKASPQFKCRITLAHAVCRSGGGGGLRRGPGDLGVQPAAGVCAAGCETERLPSALDSCRCPLEAGLTGAQCWECMHTRASVRDTVPLRVTAAWPVAGQWSGTGAAVTRNHPRGPGSAPPGQCLGPRDADSMRVCTGRACAF